MHTVSLPLDGRHGAGQVWTRVAEQAGQWLEGQGLEARDAVLILPFAQHLAPARRAWMQLGRWLPRIETTHSLASALAPAGLAEALQISFDAAMDSLSAKALLVQQTWAQALRRQDPRAYELAVGRLVEAAQQLLRAAHQRVPEDRDGFWTEARAAFAAESPGRLEAALSQVALAWASSDHRPAATDVLFDWQPSAWLVLEAGGPDPLAQALLARAEQRQVPVLKLRADVELDQVGHAPALLEQALCEDFEDQAQCSSAAVLAHLNAGRAPVALIAQDRVLLRRVRALLERRGVGLLDETGWTLATSPAAAQLMGLLKACAPQSTLDEWLALLKSGLCQTLRGHLATEALPALEAVCRRKGWRSPQSVRFEELHVASLSLWRLARSAVRQFNEGASERSLQEWIDALKQVLQRLQAEEPLLQLDAGQALLDVLWLQRQPWPGSAHEYMLQQTRLDQAGFLSWVDQTLEAQQYLPPAPEQPQVLVTPLARAMLRPFGAIVLPGADAQLGAVTAPPALISDRLAARLGLPTLQQRREAHTLAFTQLLRADALTLLRCTRQGSEPLAASPLLDRLALALQRAGQPGLQAWTDARIASQVPSRPQHRSAAKAPGQLPATLSASAIESLRDCPYQFFARALLKLREAPELEAELDKSDYGSWLHALLHDFHDRRGERPDAELLVELADELAKQLSPAEFLPFRAGFDGFVQRYLAWLAGHEAEGARYEAGEQDRESRPWADSGHALAPLKLKGRLDRMDRQPDGSLLLIDYKTGSLTGLKDKVAHPVEDTQLAVYAALVQPEKGEAAIHAQYLALDEREAVIAVPHADVEHSAALLLLGLEQDLLAIEGGAEMPALGEGRACGYCEMRGLCRRDDWQEVAL
ncbi:PD-(D/E)XK nuclease family protein [Pelomonas sp. SE-A7]|uniref:PD-(D/E)XK nuclease family protein n=1 Tax=Pelomonas sp. SE-A7 TaxID=3054953 RepID=UPI00259D08FE|nr:PD-(D/E)XK nuclease family protein [Pelomonas sp. SE-A7]MDM4764841.1 PD-(D/E)XK nuclease family protein [Pelomonas sp. SE-A7]